MASIKIPIIRIGWKNAWKLINNKNWKLLEYKNGNAELLTPEGTEIFRGKGDSDDGSGHAVYYLTKRSVELLKKISENGNADTGIITRDYKDKLLELLESWDDYWNGWYEICMEFEWNEGYARLVMDELKAEGRVESRPIFSEDLMLNGKGWFHV